MKKDKLAMIAIQDYFREFLHLFTSSPMGLSPLLPSQRSVPPVHLLFGCGCHELCALFSIHGLCLCSSRSESSNARLPLCTQMHNTSLFSHLQPTTTMTAWRSSFRKLCRGAVPSTGSRGGLSWVEQVGHCKTAAGIASQA